MYRAFYEQSTILWLPILTLLLFMGVFVGVVFRTLRSPTLNARNNRLQMLPFEDSEESDVRGGGHV